MKTRDIVSNFNIVVKLSKSTVIQIEIITISRRICIKYKKTEACPYFGIGERYVSDQPADMRQITAGSNYYVSSENG